MSYYHRRHIHGQRNLQRYRHSAGCMEISGFVPSREREKHQFRCRVMAVLMLIVLASGFVAVLI